MSDMNLITLVPITLIVTEVHRSDTLNTFIIGFWKNISITVILKVWSSTRITTLTNFIAIQALSLVKRKGMTQNTLITYISILIIDYKATIYFWSMTS